jgi:hypothetical protein
VPDPDTLFPKPYDFYYDQPTSFYQAYPLCKGVSFHVLATELISAWTNTLSQNKTLKDVGENCLKLEK